MFKVRWLVPTVCSWIFITVFTTLPACADSAPVKSGSNMDKRAFDVLKVMSDTIAQAKTVQFQSRSMVPRKAPAGVWVNLYGTSQVVMQGPDKLFARTAGDFAPYDFYFDGKTITAYAPDKNLYAVKDAPPTIDEMVEKAYREEGKSFPYADILVSEPYAALTDGATGAFYVGQSTIFGVRTDHLVFTHKNVEWQIWISTDDHLPRLVVATYLDEVNEPSYTVEFLDWKLNGTVASGTFTFQNVSQAAKVEFRNPMQQRRAEPVAAAVQK